MSKTHTDIKRVVDEGSKAQKLPKPGISAGPEGGAELAKYPAQYYEPHPMEERLSALDKARRAGLVDARIDDTGVFQKPVFDEAAAAYIKSKQEAEELLRFEQWLSKTMNLKDPNVCRYLKTMYPRFFERKMEQIDRDMDLVKRIAKMRVKGGPDSLEDLMIQFQVDSGLLDLATVNNMLQTYTGTGPTKDLVLRGVFNPRRYAGMITETKYRDVTEGQDNWAREGKERVGGTVPTSIWGANDAIGTALKMSSGNPWAQ